MTRWFDVLYKAVNGRYAWPIFICAIGLPLFGLVMLVAIFAVNVPFLDQWEIVPLFEKYHQGQLGFADFFAQHNEHRLLFPRLLMLGLAVLSEWDVRWEMAASLIFAIAAFFFLYMMLGRSIAHQGLRRAAAITTSCILFSPIQWENWLWGWQLQWYLNILGLIVAVWALTTWETSPFKRVVVAALAALVATYSLASGFFVWVVCLPVLWLRPVLRRWMWVWLALAAGAVSLHYIGYHDPVNHPAKTLFLHEPIAFLGYLMAYIGHPITLHWWHSFFVAPAYLAAVGATVAYFYRRAKSELSGRLLPWICLGLYACFAAVSTAVTRLGFSVEQAYASRYTTLSQLLLIAFVVFLYQALAQTFTQGRTRRVIIIALAIITSLTLLDYAKGAVQLRRHGLYLKDVQYCARTARSIEDPCLPKLYPLQDVVWQRLQYLRSIHWAGL